jgi:hypothetical protein
MSIRVKKINEETVEPVTFIDVQADPRPIKGRNLFPEMFANVFFCARKKSGKSCVMAKVIESCSDKDTKIIAFVSTIHRDPTWRAIKKRCEERGQQFEAYTSIVNPNNKTDILAEIVDCLNEDASIEKQQAEKKKPQEKCLILLDCHEDPAVKKKKKKLPKEKSVKIIFCFDDIAGELQRPSVTELLKRNRHFESKVLISSQSWNDIALQGRMQINYVLLFKGYAKSREKLQEIYKNCDLSVPFDVFEGIYAYATKAPFSFLWIDLPNSEFRKNFNESISITDGEEEERDL